jgi:ABC-type sugar transport system ATPase subunit
MNKSEEIRIDKQKNRQLLKEKKLKDKQLLAQRTRIYNQLVAYQKINKKKVKHAPTGTYISLQHINKIYDNKVQAVYDFSLDIKKKEFIVFVGPSGCGKSTTLRMIAGLEDITSGDLFIDKTYANDLHPKDRDIAMVFQSYALYPHMSVAGNMSFGLRIRRVPTLKVNENGEPILGINHRAIKLLTNQLRDLEKYLPTVAEEEKNLIKGDIDNLKEKIEYLKVTPVEIYEKRHLPRDVIRKRTLAAAHILQIEDYLDRKPKALSGGQRQRVALGRAIVKNAKVFLMDEPLSNLDAKLRVAMRSEIIRLHKSLDATTIYVTHDQTEAMTMATRIVVMNKGHIQQIGTPIEIYNHPANMFVATFIGSPSMNLLKATYNKGVITFAQGRKIELTPDFDQAFKKFYQEELVSLKNQFNQFDNDFIERNNYIKQIETIKEKITLEPQHLEKHTKQLNQLEKELKSCEEASQQRQFLINAIDKLSQINTSKDVEVIFGIRPEDIYQSNRVLTDEAISQEFEMSVSVAELLGHEYYCHSDFEDGEIVSKIHARTIVDSGDILKLVFDISKIHLFDVTTQKLIK